MRQRPVLDVLGLPEYGFGPRSPVWWGTVGFCVLEGMGFLIAIGGYLYLVFTNQQWPLSAPPEDLFWSSALTVLAVISVWPNRLAKQNGEHENLQKVRRDLVIMSMIGVVIATGGAVYAGREMQTAQSRKQAAIAPHQRRSGPCAIAHVLLRMRRLSYNTRSHRCTWLGGAESRRRLAPRVSWGRRHEYAG